jgi:hypothetical protein
MAIFSVPIRGSLLYISLLLIIPLLISSPVSFKGLKIKPGRDGMILLGLTFVSLIAHVYSVRGFTAPILHDPIAHGTWAKQIYDTGMIDYFYSPGLHILSALGKMADGGYIATYVLIITNLFNALIFIPVYLFIRSYFKDSKFALLSSVIFLIALYPSKFFWSAGKNALVVGLSFLFLLLFLASLSGKDLWKGILVNSFVFILILIHYPVAFIGLVGVFFILIMRGGFKAILNLLFGSLLGVLWGVMKMHYEVDHLNDSVSVIPKAIDFTLENLVSFGKGLYNVLDQVFFNYWIGQAFLFLGLIGLLLMTVVSIREKKNLYFVLFFYANIFLMYFIKFMEGLGFLDIVYKTQQLVLFIFIYIGGAFMISKTILPYLQRIDKRFIICFYIFLTGLGVFGSYNLWSKYSERQASLNMVYEEDLVMYKWMDKNIEGETIILNNALPSPNNPKIVGATDGGAWIPVFTDFDVAMPFTEFTSKKTHERYEIYSRISAGESTCDDITYLLEENIGYYYKSKRGVFAGQFLPRGNDENFELLHFVGDAKLFKIIPCQE